MGNVMTAGMSGYEAIKLIEATIDPGDLFAIDARTTYRRLARLLHPDANPDNSRAAAAFTRLASLWQQWQGRPGPLVASGDIANFYEHERGLLKIARDAGDNDLLDREAGALARLKAAGDPRYLPYVPSLAERQRHQDPVTMTERRANLIGRLDGFVSLADVKTAYPAGLDPRDVAWMWRRLLVAIGFAHQAGVIHAAIVPDHVLIHPAEHGLVLIDWCYAITEPDELAAAVPARYADWYPPEVRRRQPPGQDLDIWLASRCMTDLMGDRTPRPLAGFARGCTLPSPGARPRDAWRLLSELDAVLERLYGPRKFRPFVMPT
jgi:serine/threonine protein kinase